MPYENVMPGAIINAGQETQAEWVRLYEANIVQDRNGLRFHEAQQDRELEDRQRGADPARPVPQPPPAHEQIVGLTGATVDNTWWVNAQHLPAADAARAGNDIRQVLFRAQPFNDHAVAEWPTAAEANPRPNPYAKAKKTSEMYENHTMQQVWGLAPPAAVQKVIEVHKGQNIFGIELEIENFPVDWRDASAIGFTFTEDGSLRNNGCEAVSKPNNKQGILTVTERLWNQFKIGKNNFSDRTSIHVHANVLHFKMDQLRSLALAYQVFEELLFNYVGEERASNIFCVPWCEAGVTSQTFEKILSKPRDWHKYTALNLQPITTQGTVEFRHMHGHADMAVLTGWLTLIDELMTFAHNIPVKELVDTICKLNTSSEYGKFITRVFPEGSKYLTSQSSWEALMQRGVIESKFMLV